MKDGPDFAKTALGVAAAFLGGYAGRLAVAVAFGLAAPSPPVSVSTTAEVPAPAATAHERAARTAADEAPSPDETTRPADADAGPTTSAPEAPADVIAALALGQPATSSASAPLAEAFDVAAARWSSRNAARPTALLGASFRFLAYRAQDGFEVTCGDLARHYLASPRTWMSVLAADNGKSLAADDGGAAPPYDPADLAPARCEALRAAVLEFVRGGEALRRDLWSVLAERAAAARPPALDPLAVSAVFAGERGVAVVRRGADAELDRLLDDLARAESEARSDAEFALR